MAVDDNVGNYIVVFKSGISAMEQDETVGKIKKMGGVVKYEFSELLSGVAVEMPVSAVSALKSDPNVDDVEEDRTVHIN
ncbi:hypothetical protein SeMB42_g04211 [Synchytrium endobioticum]|uniref:Inhibitor I9 domain-containing protein n=1 Tax=Synchytrium endobioticum TaxID=286115 RepID=A0A507CM34_9FUNG|nr:hypothetical protein SeLEV6574_g07199 [Synchytrium endobioticum]TPX44759.1 hypothetical protein SeMB42_g04211 [Synchytrium endobioticum]